MYVVVSVMAPLLWMQRHNPWRAPGSAPVYDPCGMAGGGPHWIQTQVGATCALNSHQQDERFDNLRAAQLHIFSMAK